MKTLSTILILLLSLNISIAQKPKFKKVSLAELEKKVSDIDSFAKAEYIYRGCIASFEYSESQGGFEIVYKHHDRIKIYDDSYTDIANYSISYYKSNSYARKEKIFGLEAYTFNVEDGEVIKEKVSKKNIYDEEKNKFYQEKKFAFPAIKNGSVLDVKYELKSPNIFTLDEFYFQSSIPIVLAEYQSEIPQYFNYNANVKGLLSLETETKKEYDDIRYSHKVNIGSNRSPKYKTEYDKINYQKTISKYIARNVPRIEDEPFVSSMDNYRSSIMHELLYTQMPRSGTEYYTKTWNDIAEMLNSSDDFGGQLRKNYKSHDDLILGLKDKTIPEKVAAIYSTVQSEFTWNGYYSVSATDGIKSLIKNGTGNTAEINLYLINLLQKAGVSARPLVSRQRSSGFLNVSNPSIVQLNYVTAIVEDNGKYIYLDATDRNLVPNELPKRALNLKGIVIDGNIGKEIQIVNPNYGKINNFYNLSIKDESLVGTFSHSLEGYFAYLGKGNYKNGESYMKSMDPEESKYSGIKIDNFSDRSKKVNISSEVSTKGFIQNVEDNIFIDLNIVNEEFENPFKSQSRNFALFFENTYSNTDILKIKIPDGYKVESMPENLAIGTPEKLLVARISFNVMRGEIVMTKNIKLSKSIIIPEYYESVRTIYDQIETLFNEKIVLSKME